MTSIMKTSTALSEQLVDNSNVDDEIQVVDIESADEEEPDDVEGEDEPKWDDLNSDI